jgi:hypothetical protein
VFRVCSDAVTTAAVCDSNESLSEIELPAPTAFTGSISEESLDVVGSYSKGGQEEELIGVGAQLSN